MTIEKNRFGTVTGDEQFICNRRKTKTRYLFKFIQIYANVRNFESGYHFYLYLIDWYGRVSVE